MNCSKCGSRTHQGRPCSQPKKCENACEEKAQTQQLVDLLHEYVELKADIYDCTMTIWGGPEHLMQDFLISRDEAQAIVQGCGKRLRDLLQPKQKEMIAMFSEEYGLDIEKLSP